MTSPQPEQNLRDLEVEIKVRSAAYYAGNPEITDAEFDSLWNALLDLEGKHPELLSDSSPTQQLYEGAESESLFAAVRHETPMLSLQKVYELTDLTKWRAGFAGASVELMPKFDGVSISLAYGDDGVLIRAATRGDGITGEDVTANVQEVKGLPLQLDIGPLELRGELVMLLADFEAYNDSGVAKKLANPRNGAAGTLRAKSREKVADRPLTFLAFDVIGPAVEGETAARRIEALGLSAEFHHLVDSSSSADKQIAAYIADIAERRADLPYEIDGVVIRLANLETFVAAGATGHHNRGAIAYKLAPAEVISTLVDVEWQVGKSGTNAPVAQIEPVNVGGATVTFCSLHNQSMIAEKGLMIGDTVVVVRRGDVIPHIERVAAIGDRNGSETVIEIPSQCASCGGPLSEEGDSRILKCVATTTCPAQLERRLIHWASRGAADIDAVGPAWIQSFIAAGLLTSVADFYKLDSSSLSGLDGMGAVLSKKILESIENSKPIGLRRTIIGLALPLASEGTAKRLCRFGFKSIEEVAAADAASLALVPDVGPLVADSIVEFFAQPEIQALLVDLREQGVNLDVLAEDEAPTEVIDGAANGKRIVLTGTLSVGRGEFAGLLEAAGATITGSVSAKVDYVVCGEAAGSKLKKANDLGIPVLNEAEARALLLA